MLTTDTKAVIVASACKLTVGLQCAACHDISATGASNTTGLTFVATIFYCERQTTVPYLSLQYLYGFLNTTPLHYEATSSSGNSSDVSVRISAGKLAILIEIFRGFPQSLQANFDVDVNQTTSTSSHILSIQYSLLSSHLTPCILTYGQRL